VNTSGSATVPELNIIKARPGKIITKSLSLKKIKSLTDAHQKCRRKRAYTVSFFYSRKGFVN